MACALHVTSCGDNRNIRANSPTACLHFSCLPGARLAGPLRAEDRHWHPKCPRARRIRAWRVEGLWLIRHICMENCSWIKRPHIGARKTPSRILENWWVASTAAIRFGPNSVFWGISWMSWAFSRRIHVIGQAARPYTRKSRVSPSRPGLRGKFLC